MICWLRSDSVESGTPTPRVQDEIGGEVGRRIRESARETAETTDFMGEIDREGEREE